MDEAERPDTGNTNAPAFQNALDALVWDWGEAYEIEMPDADHSWRARRLDGLGEWIEAHSADDLRQRIISDYITKPVSPTRRREQEG